MRLRFLVLIVLSLVVAGGAAYMTQTYLRSEREAMAKPTPEPEPRELSTKVLVAASDLAAGTILNKSHLRWQPWPEEGVTDTYIVKQANPDHKVEGAVVRQSLARGEPLTEMRIVRPGDRGFLAAMLTPGKRAISVPVNATSGISGLVFPGDRVDIVLTHTVDKEQSTTGSKRQASETVLHDIRVLALDQRTDDQDGKRIVAKTATVEVTPKQAEKVSLAKQLGNLSLVLRPVARDGEPDTKGLTFTVDSEISAVVGTPRRRATGPKVKVVRGGETEELSF
ncbi:Flp pilus assembly protein CpaB [Ferruginivarius sediminum]|uniref:Flp pilus assembly protein CpaB n=1 Tax=Ferruginivarius sediminum TaxID=2661937 RepID=A0A369TBK4_9PROT|nr:Flp pilus assembly protein CpaB [Ferruginivarius sediminum]RDD62689.1 Flp pilus assembly protein CpaB [Ferruginivarius sediminum]